MALNVAGIVVLIAFYAIVLICGIIASKKFKAKDATSTDLAVVAGRKIGPFVGVFTMTATYVGGAYICGTAEAVATQGIAWTLPPFAVVFGMVLGGIFFARQMREKKYLTMLDPFQVQLGGTMTAMLFVSAICVDVFWSASILSALGASLSVIINLDVTVSIIVSTVVAVTYTLFGQMVAVAYTDVLQLLLLLGGLVLCVPFAMTHASVGDIAATKNIWLGSIAPPTAAVWLDFATVMVLGAIPWQSYFQRVLSARSANQARAVSIAGGFGTFLMAIPSFFIGAVGVSANWTSTDLGYNPLNTSQGASMILPLVLHHFTPGPVAIIGLSAIAAAVMSSMDSAILGCSSMFTHNIYKVLLRKCAKEKELLWAQRISILVVGAIATVLAIFVSTVYGMFVLAADLGFIVLFPQLTCAVHFRHTNSYGAFAGYVLGLILRIGGGEPYIGLPALIRYPFYDERLGQLFPFKTFAMLLSLGVIITVSLFTNKMLRLGIIPEKYDILGVIKRQKELSEARWKEKSQEKVTGDDKHIRKELMTAM